jgi:hypothetical protein
MKPILVRPVAICPRFKEFKNPYHLCHCDLSLETWLIREIIPKWPSFRLVKYYNLPRNGYIVYHCNCTLNKAAMDWFELTNHWPTEEVALNRRQAELHWPWLVAIFIKFY